MSSLKLIFGAAACLALGGWLGWRTPFPERLVFLSVGQGDCAVIQAAGRTVLVDDGPSSPTFDAGERIVIPKLRELGVDRVDLILLSHPDMDHVGGTGAILRRYPSAKVAISGQFRDNPAMLAHLRSWNLPADSVAWLGPESVGHVGPLSLYMACPAVARDEDDNDGSMFVRVGLGSSKGAGEAVLTGDAPAFVEDEEESDGDWSAEVLKAGHHGSRTATGTSWLRYVHPQWVVISCGRDNPYGHPHPATVARIKASGAKIARTDREGDITFEWRNGHLVRVP